MIKKFTLLFASITVVMPITAFAVSCSKVVQSDKERADDLFSKIEFLERDESRLIANRTIENFESLPRSGEFTMETAIKIGINDYVHPDLPFDASLWYTFENSEYMLDQQVKYSFKIKVVVADEMSDKFVTVSKYSSDQMNTYKYVQYLPREFSEIQRVATSLQYEEIVAVQNELNVTGKNKNVIYHNSKDPSFKPITKDYLHLLGFEENFIENNFPNMIAETIIKAEISAGPKTVGRPVEFIVRITAENGASKTSITAYNDKSERLMTYTSDAYAATRVKEDVDALYDTLYDLIGDAKFEYVAITKLVNVSTTYMPFADAIANWDKNWKKLIKLDSGAIDNKTNVNLSTFNFNGISAEIRLKTDEKNVPMIKFGIPEINYTTGNVVPEKYEMGESTYEVRLRIVGSTYYRYIPFTMKFGNDASAGKFAVTIKNNAQGEWEKWDAYAQATGTAQDRRYLLYIQQVASYIYWYIKGRTEDSFSSFNDVEIQDFYKDFAEPTKKSNGPDGIPNTDDDIPQSVPTYLIKDDESLKELFDAMGVNDNWYKRFEEMKPFLQPVYEYFSEDFDQALFPNRLKRRLAAFLGGQPTKGAVGSQMKYYLNRSQYENNEWAVYQTVPGALYLNSADFIPK